MNIMSLVLNASVCREENSELIWLSAKASNNWYADTHGGVFVYFLQHEETHCLKVYTCATIGTKNLCSLAKC